MTTVTLLRQTYLNGLLGRVDGAAVPWSDAQCDQHIKDALNKTWPDLGTFITGDVATSASSDLYTMPVAMQGGLVAKIDIVDSSGRYMDHVRNWRYHSTTQVVIRPALGSGATLRFYGYSPFSVTASDLPARLEPTLAERAAALAYGSLVGQLANSQRQQGLDSGRVVDYQTAVGLSAYYERRYADAITKGFELYRVGMAPRATRR